MDKKQLREDFKKSRNLEAHLKTVISWNFEDIHIFLKSTGTFNNRDRFYIKKQLILWQSELTISHFKSLLNSDLKEDLLHSFFSKPSHINKHFFKLLSDNRPDLCIKFSKLHKSFLNEEFFALYKEHLSSNKNIELRDLFMEFNFFRKKSIEFNNIQDSILKKLKNTSIEDILIQTCSYLEKRKRSDFSHTDNKAALVQIRTTITNVLCYLLSNIDNKQTSEKFNSVEKFMKELYKELPPINPVKSSLKRIYSPQEQISTKKKDVRWALNQLESLLSFNYNLDIYAASLVDFEYLDSDEAELIQNNDFILHKRNIQKYTYNDTFFLNKGARTKHNNQNFYNINNALEYWNYLKLPMFHNGVSIEKALLLLHSFSSWIIPLKRTIGYNENGYESIYTPNVPTPPEFENTFSREYLNAFNYTDLCNKVSEYFKWDINEVEKLIDFLSTYILNVKNKRNFDLCTTPFIRISNQVFWMTNLFEDHRWVVQLHKRLVADGISHNIQTAEQEKSLAKDFNDAKFNAVASHKYKLKKDNGTISGEIDTLAYKDKYLFVIEMKTTYVDETPSIKAINHSKTIEGKAKHQLNTAVEYINNHFYEIKDIENLHIDCDLSELKIIPIIVSNIFDYEGQITENGIIRISDFTLRLILNNDFDDIMFIDSRVATKHYQNFNSSEKMKLPVSLIHLNDKNNLNLSLRNFNFPSSREECNLWSNHKECSPLDIINTIKQNIVWDFVDKIWNFKPQSKTIKS